MQAAPTETAMVELRHTAPHVLAGERGRTHQLLLRTPVGQFVQVAKIAIYRVWGEPALAAQMFLEAGELISKLAAHQRRRRLVVQPGNNPAQDFSDVTQE